MIMKLLTNLYREMSEAILGAQLQMLGLGSISRGARWNRVREGRSGRGGPLPSGETRGMLPID